MNHRHQSISHPSGDLHCSQKPQSTDWLLIFGPLLALPRLLLLSLLHYRLRHLAQIGVIIDFRLWAALSLFNFRQIGSISRCFGWHWHHCLTLWQKLCCYYYHLQQMTRIVSSRHRNRPNAQGFLCHLPPPLHFEGLVAQLLNSAGLPDFLTFLANSSRRLALRAWVRPRRQSVANELAAVFAENLLADPIPFNLLPNYLLPHFDWHCHFHLRHS